MLKFRNINKTSPEYTLLLLLCNTVEDHTQSEYHIPKADNLGFVKLVNGTGLYYFTFEGRKSDSRNWMYLCINGYIAARYGMGNGHNQVIKAPKLLDRTQRTEIKPTRRAATIEPSSVSIQ